MSDFQIVPRAGWGAVAPLGPLMPLPALDVFFHHTVTTISSDPFRDMRAIEAIGIERFGRFSYSFCVHQDGTVMEGAGRHIGAHTFGRNAGAFGIAWIGNYEILTPTDIQIRNTARLIRHLQDHGWLYHNASIRPHSDVKATACPGTHGRAALPQIRSLVMTGEEDMPLDDNDISRIVAGVRSAVKTELDEGTGLGQIGWGNTSKATLAEVQGLHNLVREQAMFISDRIQVIQDKIDTLVDRLAEEIVDRIIGSVPAGSIDLGVLLAHVSNAVEAILRAMFADAATPDTDTAERPSEQAMRESEVE